jgi:hypothetical protein
LDLQHDLEVKSEEMAKEAARAGKKVFAFVIDGGSNAVGAVAKGAVGTATFAPKCLITRICDSITNQKHHHGKQKLKHLVGSGAKLEDIPITAENLGDFEYAARKHGIDYSLKRVVMPDGAAGAKSSASFFSRRKARMF